MLRRPKHSTIEVVTPKEEEEGRRRRRINFLVDSLHPLEICTTVKEKLKVKLAKMQQFL